MKKILPENHTTKFNTLENDDFIVTLPDWANSQTQFAFPSLEIWQFFQIFSFGSHIILWKMSTIITI
jgi:hypothetical protein